MVPIIDMHADSFLQIFKASFLEAPDPEDNFGPTEEEIKNGLHIRANGRHINLTDMKKAGYMCQSFAMFVDISEYGKSHEDPFEYLCDFSKCMDREIAENSDMIRYAFTGTDIEENFKAGYMSALKTVEEGFPYKGDLENLKKAYEMGVRKSTLTWNYENQLAFPNPKGEFEIDTENGLKKKGFEFVEAMEDMGIVIDISHLNDAGIFDIFKTVRKSTPVIASHSNARGICANHRNLSDEMIRLIADHGGVTGINFCTIFLNENNKLSNGMDGVYSRISDMIAHMKYIRNLGGIDMVAMGTDFDGIHGVLEVDGAKEMPKLIEAMDAAGFTEDEIEKIMYKNALRVYKEVLG
ncbi:MAG: membrane dipeptidase [Eubacteriales bacterium]|nr:membrane dipeptidase [Eubacteriales bacterium]